MRSFVSPSPNLIRHLVFLPKVRDIAAVVEVVSVLEQITISAEDLQASYRLLERILSRVAGLGAEDMVTRV